MKRTEPQCDTTSCCKKKELDVKEISIIVFSAIVLTYILIEVDITSYFVWINTNISLRTMLVLWVLASISTCLAVTWWVVVAMSDFLDTTTTTQWHIKFHSAFHLWRLISFAIFGAILWGVGQYMSISLGFTVWLSIVLSIMFVYLWWYLIGLFPQISYASRRLENMHSWWLSHSRGRNIQTPFIVWMFSFFLPCWFTQSVQIIALASWSILTWWLMMLLFAIWTIPWLLALWVWTTYAKEFWKQRVQKGIAFMLLVFGLFTLRWNASILWVQDSIVRWFSNTETIEWATSDAIISLTLSHNWYSLVPEETVLQAGNSYEITILPESDWLWCMSTMILPGIDSTPHSIKQWVPITYMVQNAQIWQYSFVCSSMGMKQWVLIVE